MSQVTLCIVVIAFRYLQGGDFKVQVAEKRLIKLLQNHIQKRLRFNAVQILRRFEIIELSEKVK